MEWAGDSSERYADIIISDLTAMPFETGEYERFETSLNYQTIRQIQREYEGTIQDYLAQDLERVTF